MDLNISGGCCGLLAIAIPATGGGKPTTRTVYGVLSLIKLHFDAGMSRYTDFMALVQPGAFDMASHCSTRGR